MFMVASSVVTTIMILNYHHRQADTHTMPTWVSQCSMNKYSLTNKQTVAGSFKKSFVLGEEVILAVDSMAPKNV